MLYVWFAKGEDEYWINNIKSPVHRLVNAVEGVTISPPGAVAI
ncbi:hypothetical protein [Thalassotalea atypica]|nr:hypothetical protein [Thalassotalea atypica]